MPNTVRTAQITAAQATPQQVGDTVKNAGAVAGIAVMCEMTGGSSGTGITGYVQTSMDGGTTWFDVMAFAFVNTAKQQALISRSDVAITSAVQLTLNALAPGANGTAINAPLGDQFRFMYTSTGTYANTSLKFSYALNY